MDTVTQSAEVFFYYLFNLHDRAPEERRAAAHDDLVCFTFEGRSLKLNAVADIEIREPLRSWLRAKVAVG